MPPMQINALAPAMPRGFAPSAPPAPQPEEIDQTWAVDAPPDFRSTRDKILDYAVDKSKDIALAVAVTCVNPTTILQNSVSLLISLGTTGDRRTERYGFALYENSQGLGRWIGKNFLADTTAFTPGCLGFASRRLSQRVMDHENQHAIQSLVTGPLYYPGLIFETIRAGRQCGFNSDCIHEISVFETDAGRAEKEGLHFPWRRQTSE